MIQGVEIKHCKSFKGLLLPGDPEYVRPGRAGGSCMIDGEEVACTIQCVHCAKHWVPIKGSGRQRGFCVNCMGPLCGDKDCMENCIPFQKKLDIAENPDVSHQVSVSLAGLSMPGR